MNAEPSISLEDFLGALTRRGIPLPFEIGTFIALETCERLARGPARVAARDIQFDDEGRIVVASAVQITDEEACRALIVLLGDLLVRSAPGVPPMLLQLVEQGPGQGEWSLARLRDDLEAALVPLNRAATRRVLARLVRESRREADRPSKRISAPPDAEEVDAGLDEVLGVEASAARARIAGGAAASPAPRSPEAARGEAPSARDEGSAMGSLRENLRPELTGGLAEFERAASQGGGGVVVAVAVAVGTVALLGALWLLAR